MAPPFCVVIPARLASTRLPRKPLADIGGKPMVVQVALRVRSGLGDSIPVVVAADHADIVAACEQHSVPALLTRTDHPSGSDRLAEAADLLRLADDHIVVNVQGDEPLIDPALVRAVAEQLQAAPTAVMATAAHPLHEAADYHNPHVVKVVLDAAGHALYFSRAPLPWWRDGLAANPTACPTPHPLRHIGLYAYRAGFLRQFPQLPRSPLEEVEALEQLRVLWHGQRIAVHLCRSAPGPGVDTPQDLDRVRALWPSNGARGDRST